MNIKKITKNILLSLGIFLLAVVLSILFQKLEVGEHITIIFMLSLIHIYGDGRCEGAVAGASLLLSFLPYDFKSQHVGKLYRFGIAERFTLEPVSYTHL